jgi:hypothetical protein
MVPLFLCLEKAQVTTDALCRVHSPRQASTCSIKSMSAPRHLRNVALKRSMAGSALLSPCASLDSGKGLPMGDVASFPSADPSTSTRRPLLFVRLHKFALIWMMAASPAHSQSSAAIRRCLASPLRVYLHYITDARIPLPLSPSCASHSFQP